MVTVHLAQDKGDPRAPFDPHELIAYICNILLVVSELIPLSFLLSCDSWSCSVGASSLICAGNQVFYFFAVEKLLGELHSDYLHL